ncbi:MAG: hypothetical protein VX642_02860 [Bdellovibrionota bacterium]|nr:hypothetical protein [Bdellovibrionota bacterium]
MEIIFGPIFPSVLALLFFFLFAGADSRFSDSWLQKSFYSFLVVQSICLFGGLSNSWFKWELYQPEPLLTSLFYVGFLGWVVISRYQVETLPLDNILEKCQVLVLGFLGLAIDSSFLVFLVGCVYFLKDTWIGNARKNEDLGLGLVFCLSLLWFFSPVESSVLYPSRICSFLFLFFLSFRAFYLNVNDQRKKGFIDLWFHYVLGFLILFNYSSQIFSRGFGLEGIRPAFMNLLFVALSTLVVLLCLVIYREKKAMIVLGAWVQLSFLIHLMDNRSLIFPEAGNYSIFVGFSFLGLFLMGWLLSRYITNMDMSIADLQIKLEKMHKLEFGALVLSFIAGGFFFYSPKWESFLTSPYYGKVLSAGFTSNILNQQSGVILFLMIVQIFSMILVSNKLLPMKTVGDNALVNYWAKKESFLLLSLLVLGFFAANLYK